MINNFYDMYLRLDRSSEFCTRDGILTVHSQMLNKQEGILHGFTTRMGGVSPAPFDTLNFSFSRADSPENVRENFRLLSNSRGFDYNSLVLVNHEHGNKAIRVNKGDCGRGLFKEPLPHCDGLVTDDPDVTLITIHADCGGIFLYDEEKRAIGLAHSGWKGTLNRMGQRLVETMVNEYGSNPHTVKAALGPCICFDCFEVDESLAEEFVAEFGCSQIAKPGRPGKAYVDIEAALCIQLFEAGIQPSNLSLMHRCTVEESELFYSYRRDGKGTGAMASYLRLI